MVRPPSLIPENSTGSIAATALADAPRPADVSLRLAGPSPCLCCRSRGPCRSLLQSLTTFALQFVTAAGFESDFRHCRSWWLCGIDSQAQPGIASAAIVVD
jgi:hypothetical protein